MDAQVLRDRCKKFALNIITFADALPQKGSLSSIAYQMVKSATSTAANYRAAGRARSKAEFYAKISIVVEEVDETLFWLELAEELSMGDVGILHQNMVEAEELLKIFAATRKTAKQNL
jgi:four helix bundle protein